MTEDMLSWLRREVEAEKTTAPSVHRDNCAHVVHAGYYPCNCPVPQGTIARCEAELRLIALYEVEDWRSHGRTPDYWEGLREALEAIAYARRHRPGYLPEWAPEGTAS